MAHVFARFISILNVHAGVKTGHQPDTKHLLPSLAAFRPTFLLAVPRVLEKIVNSAEQKAEAEGSGRLFRKAVEVAVQYSEAQKAGMVPVHLKLQHALFNNSYTTPCERRWAGVSGM